MPQVHRCGHRGCMAMVPLQYRYCDKHYKEAHQLYMKQQERKESSAAYQYHRRRAAKHYDNHVRFAGNDDNGQRLDNLTKSFGLKDSTKDSAVKDQAKELTQSMEQRARSKFYRSKQWKAVREAVFNRDIGSCSVCGSATGKMYVDHIVPLKLCREDQRLDDKNLWLLCSACHNKKTKIEERTSIKELKSQTVESWKAKLKKGPALLSHGFPPYNGAIL